MTTTLNADGIVFDNIPFTHKYWYTKTLRLKNTFNSIFSATTTGFKNTFGDITASGSPRQLGFTAFSFDYFYGIPGAFSMAYTQHRNELIYLTGSWYTTHHFYFPNTYVIPHNVTSRVFGE
jgi:hypothetical protein